MNKLLLCLCVLALCVTPCFAGVADGVLATERVVNLPNDSGKWYVSVVGDVNDARYREVSGWFTTDAGLVKLKNQVHFRQVTSATAVYKERYAANVKGLPTVRMQRPDGTVVYEAAGKNLPMTAGGLRGALADSVSTAQGILPLLPWRREIERRCPTPKPDTPDVAPDDDPAPPILNDGGTPDMNAEPAEQQVPWVWLAVLCVGGGLGGIVVGYWKPLFVKLHAGD
ncbi:MAG: hypothetical protein ACYDH4_10530 [Candidatus Cryosericum sp.]